MREHHGYAGRNKRLAALGWTVIVLNAGSENGIEGDGDVGQGSQHLRCLGLWLRRLPKPVREFVSSRRTEPSFMHGLWSSASISSPMPYSYRGVIRERERPPTGQPGKRWPSKYATLGANALGMPVIIDGLNERGLAIGLFYFPTTAKYQAYSRATLTRPSLHGSLAPTSSRTLGPLTK